MRIRVHDVEERVKELLYDEPTSELNAVFEHGAVHDYRFRNPAKVRISFYRAGLEIFVSGTVSGEVSGECARCLEEYPVDLQANFSFVCEPKASLAVGDRSGEVEDVNISYYCGEEIELSPLVREQIVLAMPTQPLCRPDCRGLCAQCGANRNHGDCMCGPAEGDAGLAVLRKMRVD